MIVNVSQADFDRAAAALPEEAFAWMHQEFAANFALQRTFPEAQVIKVERSRIEIDGRRYLSPGSVYRGRRPYRFKLSNSKWAVRYHDLKGWFYRGE